MKTQIHIIYKDELDNQNMEIIREFFRVKYPNLSSTFEDDTELISWCLAMIAVRIKRGEIE